MKRRKAGTARLKFTHRKAAAKRIRPKRVSSKAEIRAPSDLHQELAEARERLTATSDILRIIAASPGDAEGTLRKIAETTARLFDAAGVSFRVAEGDAFRLCVGVGHGAEQIGSELYADPARRPTVSGRNLPGTVVRENRQIHLPDLDHVDDEFADWPGPPVARRAGIRTMVGTPLRIEGRAIGALIAYRNVLRPFEPAELQMLQSFADQAVIAIENARLLGELRRRTDDLSESLEQQTATSEVLRVISGSQGDLKPVFEAVLANATRLCDASFGSLALREGDGFRRVALHNAPPAFLEFNEAKPYFSADISPSVSTLVRTRQVVHTTDFGKVESENPLAKYAGAQTLLMAPLLKDGELRGVFGIYRQEAHPFTEKQISLLKSFAAQAVIAIENARLLTELRESLEQQTATADVLKVISSSPGELPPVFQSALENATRLCGASFGALNLAEDDTFRVAALYNMPALFAERFRRQPVFRAGASTPLARAVVSKDVVHVVDLALDAAYVERDPVVAAVVDEGGVRALLIVPMLKDGHFIGSFNIFRREPRAFTAKQIELVKNFAAQAVIAIENTRLLSELRESLEQQTATADVLRVISSSPGDLEPVFSAMLGNAVRICGAKFGTVYRKEGENLNLVAAHNTPPALAEARRKTPHRNVKDNGLYGRMLTTKSAAQMEDAAASPGYLNRTDVAAVAAVDLGGARTCLAVPMLKDDEVVGSFTLMRDEVRPFTEKQVALVANFASQAVIAIENARLLTELRSRTEELGRSVGELRALGEVSQAVNSTLDLENVLETIVAKAVQLSGTEAGAIYAFDDVSREFHLRATYGMDRELIEALSKRHIGLDDTSIALTTTAREPIQVADLRDEPPNPINDIVLRAGFCARLTAPLLRGDQIVGMLVVRRRSPGAFAQSTVDLIKTFAAQSVLAIHNARLYANVETRTRELAASLAELRTAQDRLVQTEKLASLGQLTAGIAHEIKNPLNFVNNFSSLSAELIDELMETLASVSVDDKTRTEITELADMLRGNLEKVVQHGKRADSIVKNMLLHSRQGSGEHQLVDVNALVEESLNLAYHGARAERQGFNITLQRAFDPDAGKAQLLPQEITRVLLNLMSNGFYAATKRKAETNGGGYEPTLSAATKNLGDRVEIRIRDNGTGIPPEVKAKMFNPFFTTKPAGEGTGLGLSLSHDIIVKQHAGSIEVDTRPGEFTEFRIVLPRETAAVAAKSGGQA